MMKKMLSLVLNFQIQLNENYFPQFLVSKLVHIVPILHHALDLKLFNFLNVQKNSKALDKQSICQIPII